MDALVKLKCSDAVVDVPGVSVVRADDNGNISEMTDFKTMQFQDGFYYSFIGQSILHVYGSQIEYVLFR